MIIRDQFKAFLRGMDFHKGIYFLTADKSNAALASAEGLSSIYLKKPVSADLIDSGHLFTYVSGDPKNKEGKKKQIKVRLRIPVGKILYELSVGFGTLEIKAKDGSKNGMNLIVNIDKKGENIDRWLTQSLEIKGMDKLVKYRGGLRFNYGKLKETLDKMN